MVLFWCRAKQPQLRALSSQFKRCLFQIHESASVIRGTEIGVGSGPAGFSFSRAGSEHGSHVRFFAAPVQVKPKYEGKGKDKGRPRMNEEIHAQYVRLVTDEGHSVVPRHKALERAIKEKLDLVEVQSSVDPPVCKIMDYNKEMFKQLDEKKKAKKKSDLVLRNGGLKEVRLTFKITQHDLQTKADTVKRLAERGYRVKCMAVAVPKEKEPQDLGQLLSRLSALIDDFTLVESGPMVEAKQAYAVVRHIKFGPLKKGPGKNKSNSNIPAQSPEEEQSLNDESDSELEDDTFSEEAMELDSADDFDQNNTVKTEPETSNRYAASKQTNGLANGSENRYATMRPARSSDPGPRKRFEPESQSQNQNNQQFDMNRRGPGNAASSYGKFGAPKPNDDPQRESGPVEGNRYKKGPSSRGDFSRDGVRR